VISLQMSELRPRIGFRRSRSRASLNWRDTTISLKKHLSTTRSRVQRRITWPGFNFLIFLITVSHTYITWPWPLKCPHALLWLITLTWSYIKGFITENRSYDYIQGLGHAQGHPGHIIPHWTRLVTVDSNFLKRANFCSKSWYLLK